jgi:cytochrome P450
MQEAQRFETSDSNYISNTETVLCQLASSKSRITQATLHGKPIFIISELNLVKRVMEDSRRFSFMPVAKGTSPLDAEFDQYKAFRTLFNRAMQTGYGDIADDMHRYAKQHITSLLDSQLAPIDIVSLVQRYWLPLLADVIGLGWLPFDELVRLADAARIVVEATGQQVDLIEVAKASVIIDSILDRVINSGWVPPISALGHLLGQTDTQSAIGLARTFVLGGLDTGGNALVFATYLLANDANQRAKFITLSEPDQQLAIAELASKEAPAYFSPRYAVNDTMLEGLPIPAGSLLQLSTYGINKSANPDFDIARKSGCPMHGHETLPFGHARHKCPGENLASALSAIFLRVLFKRYPNVTVLSSRKESHTFSRRMSVLMLNAHE